LQQPPTRADNADVGLTAGSALPPPDDPQTLLKRQQAVVAMGRRALALPETSVLLQDAAGLIAKMLEVEHYAFAELAPDGARLAVRLMVRQGEGTNPRVIQDEFPATGRDSLASYALQVAHPVVSADLSVEERFRDPLLRRFGIRSAMAVPLKLQDRSLGALLACSDRPNRFGPQDVLFAESIAHLTSTNLARAQAEKRLALERSLAAEVLDTAGAIVLLLSPEGRVLRVNRACEQTTGFSLRDFQDRPIWDVFATPQQVALYREKFEKLAGGAARVEFEGALLTKHSERRWIRWSWGASGGPDGRLEKVVATGIDVTQQREAEERARRAEQLAERARFAASLPNRAESTPAQSPVPPGQPPASAPTAPIATQPDLIQRERRRRPRRAYPYRQQIAFILDGKLPIKSDFHEVQCCDISSGGFSYVSDRPPKSSQLVVILGSPPRVTHLVARVAHVTPIEHEGQTVYRVGCAYTGRLSS